MNAPAPAPRRWLTLAVVCTATFMLLLDITIVNIALPDIRRDLGASFTELQWVIDAYALSLAALMLTAGSLADLVGRRRVFAVGLALFTVASLLCGLASTPLLLDLARALQGVGGAAMFATSLALIAQTFHGADRAVAFGIWGATVGAAVAIGPLVGGALTETLGWESIFFVNVPIGIAAIAIALRVLVESRDPHARGVDWAGVFSFSAALFLLVFALVRGNAEGWGSPLIVSMLAGAAVLLAVFLAVERGQERPMLDLKLFRKPAFAGASIAAFALSASMFSMFLYLTLYLQNTLGMEPLEAGLRFLPITVVSFFAAAASGRLAAVVPFRVLFGAGLLLVGVGLLLMGGLTADSEWTALLPGFVAAGAGVGLVNPAIASTAVGVVPLERSGMGAGISNTFRQVGIATGIAGLGALFQHLLETRIPEAFARARLNVDFSGTSGEVFASGSLESVGQLAETAADRAALAQAFRAGYVDALNELFLVAGVVAILAAVLSFALIRSSDFVSGAHGDVPSAPG
jgi:EmrB/QacA subfamily drug resistance transporter